MPPPGIYNPAAANNYPNTSMGSYYSPQGVQQPMGMGMDQSNFNIPTQLFQNQAVANAALQYGQSMVGQAKDKIDQELNKYVSASRVKYFFSVDTVYVIKKLILLMFPFTHADWSIKYNPDQPVQPRYELNAPDLYIPVMAFVTYVLMGGVSLGIQERFSPEALGLQASTAMVWAILEVLVIVISLYIMNVQTRLSTFDILAYSSYKYVGMIVAIVVTFVLPSAYHLTLAYVSIAIMFFLIRSLKVQILPEPQQQQQHDPYGHNTSGSGEGSKRRTYLLLLMAAIQPFMMWWLTRHLARPNIIINN
uniref:Protein YIF1 n=1 Tax=Eubosmina coregoni TaxID=186181 RepID=A0A4Y7LRK2_9CRUS|nr:EOG090X0ATU [Eubosmina coregoni]SVE69979.1 EOG090X0ATU [Eubosmina coregoni]